MNPPKCKLCGEAHWSGVCPKFRAKRAPREVLQVATDSLEKAALAREKKKREKAAAKSKKCK